MLVDANILLYAYDESSPMHPQARGWLEKTLSGDEEIRLGLVTLLAFVRIATNANVFERPFSVEEALTLVREWLELPHVAIAEPTPRHWDMLQSLAAAGQASGSLAMDAHLATLAQEYGATIATHDRDFSRFPGVRVIDPLSPS